MLLSPAEVTNMIKPTTPNQSARILVASLPRTLWREITSGSLPEEPQNEMTRPEEQKDPTTEYDVMILPEDQ